MYRPNSFWTWTFVAIALGQALIVLALESYIFARFQIDLDSSNDHTDEKTIPTFLTLYIFGFIYQLILVWDALRLNNTIQVIGLTLYNIGLFIYSAVQTEQIKTAAGLLSGDSTKNLWSQTKGFLAAIPCVLALGTVLLLVAGWKLSDEFSWSIYKHISADLRMKKRYLTFQIYIALLKFDFFFFLGFTVQFLVIVNTHKAEWGLTLAAIPVNIGILILAAYFVQREIFIGMIGIILLYFAGLAYFIFKLVRMYEPSHEAAYLPARKELTTFAVLTIILIISTIINACVCTHNFNKGLKPYVTNRKIDDQEEKNRYSATEMTGGQSGEFGQPHTRIVID